MESELYIPWKLYGNLSEINSSQEQIMKNNIISYSIG